MGLFHLLSSLVVAHGVIFFLQHMVQPAY